MPPYIPLSPSPNTIHPRQSTDQNDDRSSVPVAAAVAPIVVGIAVFFFFCAFCLRRRSRYVPQRASTGNAGNSTNHLPLRRYDDNRGIRRNENRDGDEGPPAYTSIPVPPPAYAPDQPPLHPRADSVVEHEPERTEDNADTSTRGTSGAPEAGKEPEHTAV